VLCLCQYFFLPLFPICQSVFLFLNLFFLPFSSFGERREKREEGEERYRRQEGNILRKYLESRRIFAVLGIAVVLEILQGTDYDLRQRFIFALPHPLFLFLSFFIYFTLLWVGGIEVEEKRSGASQARTPGAAAFQRFGGFFFQFRRGSSTIFHFYPFVFIFIFSILILNFTPHSYFFLFFPFFL